MGGVMSRMLEQGIVGQAMKRETRSVSEQVTKAVEKALPKSSALGQDAFVRSTAAKAAKQMDPGLMDAIVNPTILRQINEQAVTPKLADLSKLVHDPARVPTTGEAHTFKLAIQHNAPQEAEALKALTGDERRTYHELTQMMSHRPDGHLALQNLLLDGKLTIASTQNPSRNLIQALGDLAHQDLAPGIDRHILIAQVPQEVSDPVAISQEFKGTCAATSHGQVLLSLQAPTDYVDLVAGLASPKGKAKLPNGQEVTRKVDWRAGNDRIPADDMLPGHPYNKGRSIPSQLMEPVFMQTGIGKEGWYSNTFDVEMAANDKAKQIGDGGLYPEQSARLMSSLFPNKSYTVVYPSKAEVADSIASQKSWTGKREVMSKDKIVDYLKANATPQTPVAVDVNYQLDGGHALLVTGAKELPVKGSNQTQSYIEYINPWGRLELQREDAFKTVLFDMVPSGDRMGVVTH